MQRAELAQVVLVVVCTTPDWGHRMAHAGRHSVALIRCAVPCAQPQPLFHSPTAFDHGHGEGEERTTIRAQHSKWTCPLPS